MCVCGSYSVMSNSLQTHALYVAHQPIQPTRIPLPMEFPRQEYWSGLPFLSPEDLTNPEIRPRSPALQVDSLPSEPTGKPSIEDVTLTDFLQASSSWNSFPFCNKQLHKTTNLNHFFLFNFFLYRLNNLKEPWDVHYFLFSVFLFAFPHFQNFITKPNIFLKKRESTKRANNCIFLFLYLFSMVFIK